jgi:hypothetical protein
LLKQFGEAVSTVPEIKGIEIDDDLTMPWDILKDFGNITVDESLSEKVMSNVDLLKLLGEKMSEIPEINITFSQESDDSLDRLTERLKAFSELDSSDILKNINALKELESSTSLVRSTNQQPSVPDTSQITNAVVPDIANTNAQTTTTTTNTAPVENSTQALNEQLISMLSQKLDIVIEKLGDSVDIQDRTFRYNI